MQRADDEHEHEHEQCNQGKERSHHVFIYCAKVKNPGFNFSFDKICVDLKLTSIDKRPTEFLKQVAKEYILLTR